MTKTITFYSPDIGEPAEEEDLYDGGHVQKRGDDLVSNVYPA